MNDEAPSVPGPGRLHEFDAQRDLERAAQDHGHELNLD